MSEKQSSGYSNSRNEILERLLKEKLHPRYNIVTGRIEISTDKGIIYNPISDRAINSVVRQLKARGLKTNIGEISNILESDFSPNYSPFDEYFSSLKEYDGTTDYIQMFTELVSVENQQYFNLIFKKWIVSLVACSLDPEVTNEQMLVFFGGQGVGKTTFMSKLVPKQLIDYSHTGYLNLDNKDAAITMSQTFLCNDDELSSLNPKNSETFKQILSMKRMTGVRRPYARHAETLVKYASFCGTTNNRHFLFDKTGSRRFLCLEVKSVDLKGLRNFNIDNLYSHAISLYMDDFQYWFDSKDNKLIEQNNQQFIYYNDVESAILEIFCLDEELNYRLTASDIRTILREQERIGNHVDAQKIGRALTNLGFRSTKSGGKNLYPVGVVQDVNIEYLTTLSVFKKRPTQPTHSSVIKQPKNNENK